MLKGIIKNNEVREVVEMWLDDYSIEIDKIEDDIIFYYDHEEPIEEYLYVFLEWLVSLIDASIEKNRKVNMEFAEQLKQEKNALVEQINQLEIIS